MMTKNDHYYQALDTVVASLSQWCGVEAESISLSDATSSLSKGNAYILAHAVSDIHLSLGLLPTYLPNTEEDLFPTVQSIVTYVLTQTQTT